MVSTPSREAYLDAAAFCLGVAAGILGAKFFPVAVEDIIGRIHRDQKVGKTELELAISVLDSMIRKRKPEQVYQWTEIKRAFLGREFDAMMAADADGFRVN